MRTLPLAGFVSLVVVFALSACSDSSVAPTAPLRTAPHINKQLVTGPTAGDLCGGLSPCDAYPGYSNHLGTFGVPGFCFLPPTVNNHLSDPACSGAFVPGLNGLFKLAWCRVSYPANADGTQPPTSEYCQPSSEWQDLVQDPNGGEFYTASVQWKRNGNGDDTASVGAVFRLYVVQGDRDYAFRDVVIDPNLTTPADSFVEAIGYGTDPVKVRITKDFSCVRYDTQQPGTDNAAICLVDGASSFTFSTDSDSVTFNFPDGNPTFLASIEVSECLSLGFNIDPVTDEPTGNALVDVPLAGCKFSLSSQPSTTLTVPAQIHVNITDPRWRTGVFANARLNLLEADTLGVAALPPSQPPSPNWLYPIVSPMVTSSNIALRWLGRGLEKLASLLEPGNLYATLPPPPPGASWSLQNMSGLQIEVAAVMDFDQSGSPCATPSANCLDLGSFPDDHTVPVKVKVGAPTNQDTTTYPNNYFAVPDTRLHFFPGSGTVSCSGAPGVPDADGGVCYPAGMQDQSTNPPSHWNHLVYVTGSDGTAAVDWTLASGDNTMKVLGCGVARPGDSKETLSSDGVYGVLSRGQCSGRDPTAGGFDNGPAPGLSPFEPVNTTNEVAIYGLPLTFEAHTCPQITIDGVEGTVNGTSEWACADSVGFSAPLKGNTKGDTTAWLYTYNDNNAVYVALKVKTTDLATKIFWNFVEDTNDQQAPGDELLVKDFSDSTVHVDWYLTQKCVGNNSSSLCGAQDDEPDGQLYAASDSTTVDSNSGYTFYEFKRPLGSPNDTTNTNLGIVKEDLHIPPNDTIGVRVTVTQGQGGGKGGFVYPDPQTSPVIFHLFKIK